MPATTSKKNAKNPQDHKKKASFGKRQTFPLTVPSGAEIEVTRPGLQGLIKAGILESFDSLTAIVQGEVIPKAEGQPVIDVSTVRALTKDPEKVKSITDMMDKIVMYVVADPKLVKPVKIDDDGNEVDLTDEERDPDVAYIDYVDDNDKGFIMNYAMGGSQDLHRFREESEAIVAGVPDGESAEGSSE